MVHFFVPPRGLCQLCPPLAAHCGLAEQVYHYLKNVLQQNSHVPMVKDVFHPDINVMVTMTVGTIQMKGIAQVNSINAQ